MWKKAWLKKDWKTWLVTTWGFKICAVETWVTGATLVREACAPPAPSQQPEWGTPVANRADRKVAMVLHLGTRTPWPVLARGGTAAPACSPFMSPKWGARPVKGCTSTLRGRHAPLCTPSMSPMCRDLFIINIFGYNHKQTSFLCGHSFFPSIKKVINIPLLNDCFNV